MQIAIDSPRQGLDEEQLREAVLVSLMGLQPKRLLLVADDRPGSGAGELVRQYYWMLRAILEVKILPATGSRGPLDRAAREALYGADIPEEAYLTRGESEEVGVLEAELVGRLTGGRLERALPVTLDRAITDCTFDLVYVIGQVTGDPVCGVTGYTQQLLEHCGGEEFGAALRTLEPSRDWEGCPARALCDAAEERFLLNRYPIVYLMTVTTRQEGETRINGLYVGRKRSLFEQAARLAVELEG